MSYVRSKVALITGGASGIGLVTVREFLKNDIKVKSQIEREANPVYLIKAVTIADVDTVSGERIVQQLSEEFGANRVAFIKTDVTRQEDIEEAFKTTIEAFQNVDIVVNSAGICKDSEWETEIAINLNGTVRVCLLALEKYLPTHKGGDEAVIVNISSTAGLRCIESLPVYAATKHAIIGFSRSLGTDNHYQRTKVRVLTVCPGVTDTPLMASIKDHLMGPQYKQLYADIVGRYPLQEPEEVARGIMQAIEEGKNGSVWFVHAGRIGEVKFPDSIVLVDE